MLGNSCTDYAVASLLCNSTTNTRAQADPHAFLYPGQNKELSMKSKCIPFFFNLLERCHCLLYSETHPDDCTQVVVLLEYCHLLPVLLFRSLPIHQPMNVTAPNER